MRNSPSNTDDVIDSRDIIARIKDLQAEVEAWDARDSGGKGAMVRLWAEENPDDAAELAALTALAEEAEGYADDWKHGTALIRDTYFTDYAMEMLSDVGDLPRELPGYIVIDEEATARNIQVDYTAVDFDGVTYWVR